MPTNAAYQERFASRTESVVIRGAHYQVRRWGPTEANADAAAADSKPIVFLLHGWMDVSASYQFVVDALGAQTINHYTVIAPDWRGFGGSYPNSAVDYFPFVDYYADLDALIHHYAGPQAAVDLVGHSMGGNIAMAYAGIRPHRVRRLVNLEGFGLPNGEAHSAPDRLARWLDDLQSMQQGALGFKPYADLAAVAQRLMKNNPRLPLDKALWLAPHWAQPTVAATADETPSWNNRGDVAHKVSGPYVYRSEEMLALYRRIQAPVLAVEASDDSMAQWPGYGSYSLAQYHERLQSIGQYTIARIDDAGHMLHHDQPDAVATLLRDFLHAA